jgi:hypothetical protein
MPLVLIALAAGLLPFALSKHNGIVLTIATSPTRK